MHTRIYYSAEAASQHIVLSSSTEGASQHVFGTLQHFMINRYNGCSDVIGIDVQIYAQTAN